MLNFLQLKNFKAFGHCKEWQALVAGFNNCHQLVYNICKPSQWHPLCYDTLELKICVFSIGWISIILILIRFKNSLLRNVQKNEGRKNTIETIKLEIQLTEYN